MLLPPYVTVMVLVPEDNVVGEQLKPLEIVSVVPLLYVAVNVKPDVLRVSPT